MNAPAVWVWLEDQNRYGWKTGYSVEMLRKFHNLTSRILNSAALSLVIKTNDNLVLTK